MPCTLRKLQPLSLNLQRQSRSVVALQRWERRHGPTNQVVRDSATCKNRLPSTIAIPQILRSGTGFRKYCEAPRRTCHGLCTSRWADRRARHGPRGGECDRVPPPEWHVQSPRSRVRRLRQIHFEFVFGRAAAGSSSAASSATIELLTSDVDYDGDGRRGHHLSPRGEPPSQVARVRRRRSNLSSPKPVVRYSGGNTGRGGTDTDPRGRHRPISDRDPSRSKQKT